MRAVSRYTCVVCVGGNFINYRKTSTNSNYRSLPEINLNNLCMKHLFFTKNREMSPQRTSEILLQFPLKRNYCSLFQEFFKNSDQTNSTDAFLPSVFARGFLLTIDLSFASTETKFKNPTTKTQNNIVIFGFFHIKMILSFWLFLK